jgi:hypothetical protein
MEIELASDATVCTSGSNLFCFVRRTLQEKVLFWNKGPHRTGLNTFPAKNTNRIFQGAVSLSHNLGFMTPVIETYGVIYLDFIASLDTAAAKNASGKIAHYKWVYVLNGIAALSRRKVICFDLVPDGQILKMALPISRTKVLMLLCCHGLQLEVGPGIHVQVLNQAVMLTGSQQYLESRAP